MPGTVRRNLVIWVDLGKTHPRKSGDSRIFGAELICQWDGNSVTEVPLIAKMRVQMVGLGAQE